MKQIITLLSFLFASLTINAQITTQQARPIDSALIFEHLDEGEFHTTNYHGVTFPPGGYWTWDAGCGLYLEIDDYFLAWSHTGVVADTLAACIDTMPSQAYRLFNLETMANIAAYRDSVELWLGSLGIPVGVRKLKQNKLTLQPNPFDDSGTGFIFPINGNYTLWVNDLEGITVYQTSGIALRGQRLPIEIRNKTKGVFIFRLSIDNQIYTELGIKN